MKLKCIKIISPITGLEIKESDYLTIGDEYIALSLSVQEVFSSIIDERRRSLYRIETESWSSPGLFDSRQFEVVSGDIPECWVMSIQHNGSIYLGPEEWNVLGFWEKFFDDVPDAVEIYQRFRDRILLN